MIRLEGPHQGGTFDTDFRDWEWGDLTDVIKPVVDMIAEHVGEVVTEQYAKDMLDEPVLPPQLSGCDEGVCINIKVWGEGSLIIPLTDIEVDNELFFFDRKGDFLTELGGDPAVEVKHLRDAILLLQRWVVAIEERIEEIEEETA